MRAPESREPARQTLPRAWILVALATIVIALGCRLSNAVARGAFADYDAHGHLMNTAAILNGSLPHPKSWSGQHPPLFHAIGALLVRLAPDTLPMHVTLRLLSLAAGLGALFWSWHLLRRRCDPVDATVVSLFVGCTPVVVIATSMLGNETLCAFFVTATLAGLIDVPAEPRAALRRSLRNGLFAGLAVISKVTGLLVVVTAVLNEVALRRRKLTAALRPSLVHLALPLLIVSPWLAWWIHFDASPWAALSATSLSPYLLRVQSLQVMGERHLIDYLRFPTSAILDPTHLSAELNGSVFGLLYASVWGDVHEHFFSARPTGASLAEHVLGIAGLLPTALAALGAIRILRSPRRWSWAFAPLLFLLLLFASFVVNTWRTPTFSVVKASFLLSGLLPASILLVAGLEGLPARLRSATRGVLVALALAGALTFWFRA